MRAPLLSRSHRRRRRIQFPIEIFFDGDAQEFFIGGWSEVGGNVLNDQIVLGSELIVNGDFSAWTSDDPDNWTVGGEVANDPEVSEAATGESHADTPTLGGELANLYTTVDQIRIQQDTITIGQWNTISLVVDTVAAGSIRLNDAISNLKTGIVASVSGFIWRAATVTIRIRDFGVTCDVTIDDVTVKQLTFTSLLNILKPQFGLSDGFFVDVHINAVTAETQVGAIWNYDGSSNFGMAYMDGTDLIVDKNVNGTYSNLASVGQAVTPDQILRIENPAGTNVLDILYNGVSKATPTIADASVIGNPGIALFSTEANNAISKVVIGKL
jgi:hypothetical protein